MSLHFITDAMIQYGGLMLLHGTALAIVTWLLSVTLLRRTRPAIQAALWTLVLMKFLVPPVLPGEMALSGWVARAVSGLTTSEIAGVDARLLPTTALKAEGSAQETQVEPPVSSAVVLLLVCYMLGVMLLSARALLALLRARRRIRALPFADDRMRDEVKSLAAKMGVSRPPDVRITDDVVAPYVLGFGCAVLVLPDRLLRNLDPAMRRALILHELAHLRRRDPLIRWLQAIAGVLFFFFPPVLWVCRRVEHFTEMACDRWAVTVSGVKPSAYADALVQVLKELRLLSDHEKARTRHPQVELPLLRGGHLEERLRGVLRNDGLQSPRLSVVAKAVMAGWAFFVLAGGEVATEAGANQAIFASSQKDIDRIVEAVSRDAVSSQDERTTKSLKNQGKAAGGRNPHLSSTPHEGFHRQSASHAPDEKRSEEQRAIDSTAPQNVKPLPERKVLSPYEEGFLAAQRYAQERARLQPTDGSSSAQADHSLKLLDADTRRQIERRAIELQRRGLTFKPLRQ